MNSSNNTSFHEDIIVKFNIEHLLTMIDIPITILGSITNLINIIIFNNKTFKDKIFTYLLYHSIAEFIYLFLCTLLSIPYCGIYCDFKIRNSYISMFIELAIDDYFTSCLAIFNTFLEIFISLQRYSLLSSINLNWSSYRISITLLIISLLYYSPVLFIFKIEQINDNLIPYHLRINGEKYYDKVLTNFSLNHQNFQEYFEFIVNFIRGPVCMALLTIINIITLFKFRKQIKKKLQIKRKQFQLLISF
jgi:hypothetical protein